MQPLTIIQLPLFIPRGTSGPTLFLPLCLAVTVLLYWPGLAGPFTFDDDVNITQNIAIQQEHLTAGGLLSAALSYGAWPLKRPLSMLSLALNWYASGAHPFGFKFTNLVIHLLNGLLLYTLTVLLLGALRAASRSIPGRDPKQAHWVALLVTAVWLLHPINVTGVLYVVQRMAALSALFCLAGMLLYTWGRLRIVQGRPGGLMAILAACVVATPLAFLSKETGVLLPAYLFLIEWLLFGFGADGPRTRRWVAAGFGLTLGLPALWALAFLWTHPTWITDGYQIRPFTLEQRLLTEPRVLWLYLRLLLLPRPSALSLFHDDLPLSDGLLAPWTTLPALLGLAALLLGALALRRRWPLAAFGMLFFFAGHLLESSVFPLEIAHEHRNYLPGIGIWWALIPALAAWRLQPGRQPVGGILVMILVLLFGAGTTLRVTAWRDAYSLALTGVTDHPGSARWQHQMGQILWVIHEASKDPQQRLQLYRQARERFLRAASLDRFYAPGSLLGVLQIDSTAGVASDAKVAARLSQLLAAGPVAPFTVTCFVTLLECRSNAICGAPIPEVEHLINALLGNPRLLSKDRGKLLAGAAQYAANRVGLQQAIGYATAAVAAAPTELQHHLNLAALQFYAGRADLATAGLEYVRRHDARQFYAAKCEHLAAQLAGAGSATGEAASAARLSGQGVSH